MEKDLSFLPQCKFELIFQWLRFFLKKSRHGQVSFAWSRKERKIVKKKKKETDITLSTNKLFGKLIFIIICLVSKFSHFDLSLNIA